MGKAPDSRGDAPPEPPGDRTPVAGFGIGAVSRMTGVDEHTLRIWERRYGFPRPERSAGGTRLYKAEDVRKLRLIGQLLAQGHRPGEVVAHDAEALEALLRVGELPPPAGGDLAAREREEILLALRREDVEGLRAGLRRLAVLLGPRRFVVDLARPLAARVGELWEAGDLQVHQEHLFSDCLSTQLRLMRSLFDDARGPIVLLTTLPGEPHGLGLEMIALYLASAGAAPRVLGVSTPEDQIALAARAHQAAAVGLAVMPSSDLPGTAGAVRRLVGWLPRGTQVWLGGGGAARLPAIPGARVVVTWPELDDALSSLVADRGRPVPR
jgi:DNA-binding transcriptional MerR regulator